MNTTTETPEQEFAQEYLNKGLVTASGCLSVIGSSITILTYGAWKSIRTTSRLIIVYISIGDLVTAATNVVGSWHHATSYHDQSKFCEAAATVNTIAVLSTFFWTTFLAIYLYLAICKQIEPHIERVVLYVFRLVGWGVPAVIVFVALGRGKIGNTGDYTSAGWCWIQYNEHDKWNMVLWMFLAGKGWELLAYVMIVVFYVKVKLYISKQIETVYCQSHFLTQSSRKAATRTLWKFAVIPVVFILLRIWGTVRFFRYIRFLITEQQMRPIRWLIIMHGIGDSLQGFANFLLYCLFTNKIRIRLQASCSRLFPCCALNESVPLILEETDNADHRIYASVEVNKQLSR